MFSRKPTLILIPGLLVTEMLLNVVAIKKLSTALLDQFFKHCFNLTPVQKNYYYEFSADYHYTHRYLYHYICGILASYNNKKYLVDILTVHPLYVQNNAQD